MKRNQRETKEQAANPAPGGAGRAEKAVETHSKTGGRRWDLTAVSLLAVLSGAAALSYEVVWTRHLEFVFGVTQSAVSTTVAAFMGGMALGSWLYARLARSPARPLAVYGLLETAIGVYSLTVPELLSSVQVIYRFLGVTPPASVLTLWRLVASFVILAPATVAMGATFPALVAALRHRPDKGKVGGVVYGLNTLGAVAGALLTGLVLFPAGGLALPAQTAAAASILAGLSALWVSRSTAWVALGAQTVSESSADRRHDTKAAAATSRSESHADQSSEGEDWADGAEPDAATKGWHSWALTPDSLLLIAGLAAAFLGGMAALGAEVVWNRVLGLLLDGTVYGFSVLLGGYLAGIAIGSVAMSRLLDRGSRSTAELLAWIHVLASLSAILFMALVSVLPGPLARIAASQPNAQTGFFFKALILGGLLLLPTFFFGAAFPAALDLVARSRSLGRAAGWTAAASTLGGILGALGAGLWLPGLSVSSSKIALIAASLSLIAGLGVAWLDLTRTAWKRAQPLAILKRPLLVRLGVPVLLFGLAAGLGPDFHVARIAAARYAVEDYDHRLGVGPVPKGTLIFEAEGRQTIVTLRRTSQGGFRLRNNGLNEAYHSPSAPHFADVIYFLGSLGYALRPDSQRALLVGLGSGGTAETLLASKLKRLDVVEIEPKVAEAARLIYFLLLRQNKEKKSAGESQRVRIDPLADPRTRLVIDDARNYLLRRAEAARGHYDIIVSQPSHPWLSGMGTIYSREFFELVAQNLSPTGVFCQWVNLFRMDERALSSVLATMASVFPAFHVFYTDSDSLVVVAAKGPFGIDPATIERHLEEEAFGAAADRQGLGLAAFLTAYAFDRKRALRLARGARPITDLRPLLEMRLPWAFHGTRIEPPRILEKVGLPFGLLEQDLNVAARVPRSWSLYAEAAVASMRDGRLAQDLAFAILDRARAWTGVEAWRITGRAAAYLGDEQRALASYERAAKAGDAMSILLLGRLLADMGRDGEAETWLKKALGTCEDSEARLSLAALLLDREPERAQALLEDLRAVPYQEESITCQAALLLAKLARRSGDVMRADELVSEHLDCQADSMDGWYLAAWLSASAGRDEEARIQATKAVRIGWTRAEQISNEGRRMAQNGYPAAAFRRYRKAVALDPNYRAPYQWMAEAWRRVGRYCAMLAVERDMRDNLGAQADEWLAGFRLRDTLAQRLGRTLASSPGACDAVSHAATYRGRPARHP